MVACSDHYLHLACIRCALPERKSSSTFTCCSKTILFCFHCDLMYVWFWRTIYDQLWFNLMQCVRWKTPKSKTQERLRRYTWKNRFSDSEIVSCVFLFCYFLEDKHSNNSIVGQIRCAWFSWVKWKSNFKNKTRMTNPRRLIHITHNSRIAFSHLTHICSIVNVKVCSITHNHTCTDTHINTH